MWEVVDSLPRSRGVHIPREELPTIPKGKVIRRAFHSKEDALAERRSWQRYFIKTKTLINLTASYRYVDDTHYVYISYKRQSVEA